MLDLQARVHFQEVEVTVAVDDEFDGAGRGIAHRLRKRTGLFAHRLAGGLVEEGRGRLFDDLLVPALDRAFAFVEVDAIPVLVGQHLNLDVTRLRDELLDEDAVVAEAGRRLVLRGLEALGHLALIPGDPHALAAAAGTGLDHDRIADLAGNPHRLVRIGDQAHVARHGGDTGRHRQLLGGDLVAHRLNRGGRRADEHHARRLKCCGEVHVFAKKSVTRMHRFGPGGLDRGHDLVYHDIGLRGGCRADMHGLVRHGNVQRVAVSVGIDRDGLDPHLSRCLDNAAGDLAAVGDQDLLEHRSSPSGTQNERTV